MEIELGVTLVVICSIARGWERLRLGCGHSRNSLLYLGILKLNET